MTRWILTAIALLLALALNRATRWAAVLRGVFFSSANFPKMLQPFIQALPLTATVDALRAIMLRGAPLTSLSGELLLLTGWLVLPFAAALRIFRWR